MRKKWIALTLTLAMVLSLLPVSALAEEGDGLCEHHPVHTEDCGYRAAVEGQECTHVCGEDCYTDTTLCQHKHDESCYSDGILPAEGEEKAADACPHVCSEETGCVTRVPGCSHTHDDSCGFVEAVEGQPCGFVCNICSESGVEPCPHGSAPDSCGICPVQALIDALPDTVTENAAALLAEAETAMSALTEAERAQLELTRYTALAALLAQGDRVITAWAWIDEEEVLDEETGGLALPGASEETPAFFEDVTFLLPCEIRATVEGAEEILTLDGWLCGDYPMEMGAGSGEYRFEAVLPEGYVLGEGVKALTVPVLLGGGAMWATVKNISYRYCDSNGKNWETKTCASATVVESGTTTWSGGWYVVNSNVTIDSRVTVSSGNSLTIYGQTNGTGTLTATGTTAAGIGGNQCQSGGSITINGGTVIASATAAAGIGGGYDSGGNGGTVTINGGTITATGSFCAAGIGGGSSGTDGNYGGTVTINGGTVTATGGQYAAGIGGGAGGIDAGRYTGGSGATVTINGGTVIANSTKINGFQAPGIGGGIGNIKGGAGGSLTVNGGYVVASGIGGAASKNGNSPGASGTFSVSGNSVVVSDYIKDKTNEANWSGIIFEGDNGAVYGNQTLSADLTIAQGQTLTIPENVTLTIPEGVTLTVNGSVYVDGTLTGTVNDDVYYPLTVNSGTASGNTSNYNSKNYGRANGTITLTPDAAPAGKAFSKWESGQVTVSANNQFQMPAKAVTVTALFGDIVASVTVGQTLTNYASLTEAFAFANGKAAEITLLKDALSSDPLTISGGDITFEGGNNTMLGCITISGGTFHFKSGTLKPATNGIIVSGGTLDFQGGTIEGDYYGWSVQITSGEANISGGTLHDISATGSGRLNVSGGEISCLSVDGATTALSGGSFGEINTTGKVSALLADGYAYHLPDGSWVDATHGDNGTFLSGGRESIQILSVPVKITTQPVDTSLTYSESKFLSVTAEGTGVTYQWYVSGTAIDSATGSSLSLSTLNAGSYQLFCRVSCNGYDLDSNTVTVTVGKATVTTPSVPGKVYTGSVQTGEVPASTLYTVTKNQGGTNADSYEVILTLTDPNNYQWDSAGGKTTFRITMATSNPWTTEPAISGWIYGDTPSTPTGAAKFGTVTVTYISKEGTPAYYGETPPTKAGDYMAVFSVAETPNYIGKQEVKDFTISLRPLTLTVTVKEKAFDGTTDAEIDTVTPKGIVSGDRVQVLNGTPTFACANAGTGIPVSLTRFSLEGADADNYSLVQPTGVTGTIRASQRYLNLEGNGDFAGQTEVWLDGEAYPIRRDKGAYVTLPAAGELLTIYTYKQGSSSGTHENYPTGMAVYRVTRADSGATLARISKFDDLLQHSGCSIRITGQQGIRMITSLTRENKKALTGAGLAGCTLEEYGTVVLWAKDLGGASLTLANGKSNYAYKKGVADPVFAATGSLTQYTNVLVWESLTGEQLGQDLVMRPYIILRDAGGKTVTLYGGCVTRSIGYIACRNRATYSPGTPAYRFVWDIIHAVYGTQFDSEYKG